MKNTRNQIIALLSFSIIALCCAPWITGCQNMSAKEQEKWSALGRKVVTDAEGKAIRRLDR